MVSLTEHHVQFFTAVRKGWLPLLHTEKAKEIIINDLKFRIQKQQLKIVRLLLCPIIYILSGGLVAVLASTSSFSYNKASSSFNY